MFRRAFLFGVMQEDSNLKGFSITALVCKVRVSGPRVMIVRLPDSYNQSIAVS